MTETPATALAAATAAIEAIMNGDEGFSAEDLARAALRSPAVAQDAVRAALEPIWHWYQSDEHEDRPLNEIVADVVADLQADRAFVLNPPKHQFWMPGEADCPREIKAENGELHTLRCKVCGLDSPRDPFCRAALADREAPAAMVEGEGGQDRKFRFDGRQFVNRVSGEPIPLDEPIIIFRARDRHSEHILRDYLGMAEDDHHREAIRDRMREFADWRKANPGKIKEPGITRHIRLNSDEAPK